MNNSADILAFGSAPGFAGRPVAFGSLGGFGRVTDRQVVLAPTATSSLAPTVPPWAAG
jgi:hypothetical protein